MALTLKFEVAFNAGYATAAASRTWTDITSYVVLSDGVDIQFGGRDPLTTTEPNTLSLTLDNRDGRFTPERSSSPYYPNVKLYRPIRVTATLPDASTSTRFLGYVTEWPTSWPDGSDAYSAVTLTAVSRMARLGSTTSLRSMREHEVLLDTPLVYYTLGDASGSTTASDTSGNGVDPARTVGSGTDVVFGNATGPGSDGLTAATFAGGKFLTTGYAGTAAGTAECWFLRSGIPASTESLLYVSGSGLWTFSLNPGTGRVSCGGGAVSSSANLCDGSWHHLVFVDDGASARQLFVDGVLDSTAVIGFGMTLSNPSIGGNNAGNPYNETPLSGSIAHVAVYSQALSPTRIASHFAVGAGTLPDRALDEESTSARLIRIAGYAGVPTTEINGSGLTVVGSQDTTGKTVLDALRDVEATEAGVLYDERDGTLTMTARSSRYSATSAFTLDVSSQQIGPDLQPTYDSARLLNSVSVNGPSASARYFNQTSINDYGAATGSGDTLATDGDEPLMLAGWKVNAYSQPSTRVSSLTVDVLPLGTGSPSVMNVAAATVGTLLSAANLPTQAAATTSQYFVEGYTEHFSPESWEITFNVSPAAPYTNTWVLDSLTRSQLGTSTILAL